MLHGRTGALSASREALRALPPLISLHEFWSNSVEKWNFQISPDGKSLAWLGDVQAEAAIEYQRLDEETTTSIYLGRSLEEFWWAEDSRHLFFFWDEYGDENFHLLMADTEHPDAPYVDLTPYPGVVVYYHQQFPDDPAHILIQHNRRDRAVFDLYRLNIYTREEAMLEENPGDVLDWFTDLSGEVMARSRQLDEGGWNMEVYDRDADTWTVGFSGEDEDEFSLIGYSRGLHHIKALSSRGRDRTSVVEIDFTTGVEKVIYEHPEVDVESADAQYPTDELTAVFVAPDFWRVKYFDPELEAVMSRFRKGDRAYAEKFDSSRDDRFWIIDTESDTEGLTWYLYDKETKEQRILFGSEFSIHERSLSAMQPIEFTAQDGLPIHGYLTIPVGSTGTNLPMVVVVHDGPWDRTYWEFNREAQFLANRGYAVLDVNFRGSTGYGKEFMNAGIGEFASAMHSDILDAVSWAIAEGVADPDRIAIYGWGYGGYEALVAASYTPDVFAAVIDAAGATDWKQVLESLPSYMQESRWALETFIGDPSTRRGRKALKAASPIWRIDQIRGPLLVVQGGNDAWGIQDQVEEMVARLRERDVPVEYLLLENEGRSIQSWENDLRFYRALEGFLAKHLGGRGSPITADEMWLGLQ
jgi:dipeptidyl aminopeptidase/acylaminoacyl peptidase